MTAGTSKAPVVLADAVTKSYAMGETRVEALRGVSFEASAGEMVGLTGPSGSGKSTLLHLCGLIDTPDSGTCRLEGTDTAALGQRDLTLLRRDKVGFVFQSFNLVPVMTALENVEYPLLLGRTPARARRERAVELLGLVGLSGLEDRLPDALSGGQRQRVAVARALVGRPRLVVADEPTANLDTATAGQVVDLMRDLSRRERVTFLVATHDERMVSRCDRVLRLRDGVLA